MGGGCGERGDEGAWRGTEREVKQGWDKEEKLRKTEMEGKMGRMKGDGRSTLANEERERVSTFVHT